MLSPYRTLTSGYAFLKNYITSIDRIMSFPWGSHNPKSGHSLQLSYILYNKIYSIKFISDGLNSQQIVLE